MNLNWKTILKKAGIILLSTLLFALCSGLLYITKMAGSINITRPEDEPELASATDLRGKSASGYYGWVFAGTMRERGT